ncbi:MAG: R3H domain-containing nucleic acid-binding protein [Bradymonadales bacterium]|jgi:spoIIIJ-associated protein
MDFERNYSHETLEEAADFLQTILNHMGYDDLSVQLGRKDEIAIFNIVGANAQDLLSDQRGNIRTELSNALAWVLRRARFALGSAYTFFVDVDGYRMQRLEALAGMAQDLHDKALDGLDMDIFGMDPVDRRAVHNALSEYEDVHTMSDGNGIFRRLQIRPKERVDLPIMAKDDEYRNR